MSYTRSSDVSEENMRVVKRVATPIHTRSKKKCVEQTVTVSKPTYPTTESSKNSASRNLLKDFAKSNHLSTADDKPLLENTRSAISPKPVDGKIEKNGTPGKTKQNVVRKNRGRPPKEIVNAACNLQPASSDDDDVPETRNLDIFWLKSESAIAVQYYKGEVFVHVREYFQDKNTGHFLPTKRGVRMNLDTYYDFGRKIFSFADTLCYPTESLVVGNSVLAIVDNDRLRLQNFTKSTLHYEYILLDMEQLQVLRETIYDVDNAILCFLYSDLLQSLVCVEKSAKEGVKHPHLEDLKHLIEVDLTPKIEALFYCDGCAFNKVEHECQTKTLFEKYETLQSPVALLCDVQSVAKSFLSDHAKLRACKSDFDDIYNNLFVANPA